MHRICIILRRLFNNTDAAPGPAACENRDRDRVWARDWDKTKVRSRWNPNWQSVVSWPRVRQHLGLHWYNSDGLYVDNAALYISAEFWFISSRLFTQVGCLRTCAGTVTEKQCWPFSHSYYSPLCHWQCTVLVTPSSAFLELSHAEEAMRQLQHLHTHTQGSYNASIHPLLWNLRLNVLFMLQSEWLLIPSGLI